jgi:putative ABC transport system permease protein
MNEYLQLSAGQVALAASLVVLNGLLSIVLRLGLERSLLLAGVRMVAQLALMGFVLKWVFAAHSWPWVVLLMLVMTLVAGVSAVRRSARPYPGIYWHSIVAVWASSWLITVFAVTAVLRQSDPWREPQYTIPLLGMILGNTLNGISLGLGRLTDELVLRRDQVELLLALGATRWEAARGAVRQAVRTGMIPTINAMMVTGIVSLPGMMTGQLLSGVDPLDAVKYQIVIMFLIASGTALGTVSVVLLGYFRLFNPRHQFMFPLIRQPKG